VLKQRQTFIIFLAALLAAVIAVPTVGAAPPDPTLKVEPAQLEVPAGQRFQVRVTIAGVENLGGFQVRLAYDPSVLEVKDAAVEEFLTSTGRTKIPVGPQVDNDGGSVVLGAATFGDAAGPNGSGVLATITCKALGEGSSELTLEDVQVMDTAAGSLSVEMEAGQVVVGGAAGRSGGSGSSVRWGWIVGAAVLAVAGAAVLAVGVLRRE
jgi:hypothetical protein